MAAASGIAALIPKSCSHRNELSLTLDSTAREAPSYAQPPRRLPVCRPCSHQFPCTLLTFARLSDYPCPTPLLLLCRHVTMSAADVIGILSSALHAAHKLYDIIQLVKNAPDDMDALQVEVRRVRSILIQSVQMPEDVTRDERNVLGSVTGLRADLIQQARQWTEGANQFVEKATKAKEDGSREVNKWMWPLRAADAKKLADESRRFYQAVSAVYSIDTSYVFVSSLHANVDSIAVRTHIRAIGPRIITIEEHAASISDRIVRMENLLQPEALQAVILRSLRILSRQQREGRHQHFDELKPSSIPGNIHYDSTQQPPIIGTDVPHELTPLCYYSTISSLTTAGYNSQIATMASPASDPVQTTSISRTLHSSFTTPGASKRACTSQCRCRCHKQLDDYRPVPRELEFLLGDVRIPNRLFGSIFSSSRPCDDAQCVRTKQALSTIKWYLPRWFAQVHAEVSFQSLPVHFVIQTPRVVQSLDFMYRLSFRELKIKLSNRELTVNDVEPSGFTVLHVCSSFSPSTILGPEQHTTASGTYGDGISAC